MHSVQFSEGRLLHFAEAFEKPASTPPIDAQSDHPKEAQDIKKMSIDFARIIQAAQLEPFVNTAGILRGVITTTKQELPSLNIDNLDGYSIEELQRFLAKAHSAEAIVFVVQVMMEHPDAPKAHDAVKPLLENNDLSVYAAALSYMMAHGRIDELPVHITNANDMLANVLATEGKLVQEYRTKVAARIQRARETGEGQKSHLLIEKPDNSRDLFLQYSSLTAGYGAALRREQDTLPQLRTIFQSSKNNGGLVSVGCELIKSGRFQELKDMLVTSREESKRDALIVALFQTMYLNDNPDQQAKSERGIIALCRELMVDSNTFSSTQKEFLKQMSGGKEQ